MKHPPRFLSRLPPRRTDPSPRGLLYIVPGHGPKRAWDHDPGAIGGEGEDRLVEAESVRVLAGVMQGAAGAL